MNELLGPMNTSIQLLRKTTLSCLMLKVDWQDGVGLKGANGEWKERVRAKKEVETGAVLGKETQKDMVVAAGSIMTIR